MTHKVDIFVMIESVTDIVVENHSLTTTTPKMLGGITGKGFMPGNQANPGGRPKGIAALVREQTNNGAELVQFAMDILRGKMGAKLDHRIDALQWLADRGWGKALITADVAIAVNVDLKWDNGSSDDQSNDYPPEIAS